MVNKTIVISLSLVTVLLGCATSPSKPILYPNAHYNQVGQHVANQDIASCIALAHSSGVSQKKEGEVTKNAAGGAAIGGATAGAAGRCARRCAEPRADPLARRISPRSRALGVRP